MRVLMLHNRYLQLGGEDVSYEMERELLRDKGVKIDCYEEDNKRVAILGSFRTAARTIWSLESYRKLRAMLQEKRYDVLHVQNFFPLISPSAYYAARAEGVPVVQTLRNYRLLCPVGNFTRDQHICEECLGKTVAWPGIRHACYRDSRFASGVVAAMVSANQLLGTWSQMVDVYVALSRFARDKFVEGGLPAERIMVKPNFLYPDPAAGEGRGDYAVFVGRLTTEKGIDTLLAAWNRIGGRLKLKIVGDGPLAPTVAAAVDANRHVEWLGRRSLPEVLQLLGAAKVLIFPSKMYETFGRTVIEAFAKGTPVIASNLGAVAEIIVPKGNGLLFRPGDPDSLADQVEWVLSEKPNLAEMRARARSDFDQYYSGEPNYGQIMRIYETAIERFRGATACP